MNHILDALKANTPTAESAMNDSATFSPRRWKTGWPHHLRRIPPFRDDATASLTRAEVFAFADDANRTNRNRDQVIDFLGAAFAYSAGQSSWVLPLQQFLRNKGQANNLMQALRKLDSNDAPEAQYAAVAATGLPAKYASDLAYYLAGPQSAEDTKPVIICAKRAAVAGLEKDSDWSAEEYAEYYSRLREARDTYDKDLPLDAVEWAIIKYANS
ncbi:hypothetical protein [Corynebacterium mayonis]|uniref:8-oxoguanine DNA glycosylase OGG fold protein n=1 Tax=Corynebacterium mayonis TaxID=3062461 RepID=UPI00314016B4